MFESLGRGGRLLLMKYWFITERDRLAWIGFMCVGIRTAGGPLFNAVIKFWVP